MPISPFYRSIRERLGSDLLLIPGVAGVVRDGAGRVLVQRTHSGVWSLPAGAVEPGEPPAKAVVREIREETGLRVRVQRILGVLGGADCRVTYENGDQVEYVATIFECIVVSGLLLESNDETESLHWILPNDMPRLAFPVPAEVVDGSCGLPHFAWCDDWR